MQNQMPPVSDQDHVRGDPNAVVTLVEYGGYQCPHSAAVQPMVAQLLQKYPTRLRHVFRHFPLEVSQPVSALVAEAAEFAASRGAFWHMHAMLFARPGELTFPLIFAFADRLGLPRNGLRDALATGAFASRVRQDFARGVLSGVEGTPTFFIEGQRHSGPNRFDAVNAVIRAALERLGEARAKDHLLD